MIDRITSKTNLLEKSVDAAWLKNEVISNNIANVNTPGYKRSFVRFEEFLNQSMIHIECSGINSSMSVRVGSTNIGSGRGQAPSAVVAQDRMTAMRKDGNNVDVDVEMAELAKNTIKYNTLVTQLSKQFSGMRMVINEGRK